MKKLFYLFLYTIILCSVTGCTTTEGAVVDKPEEQKEAARVMAQEPSGGTLEKQNGEMKTGKESDSAGTEMTETVAEEKTEEEPEEVLTTVICKRERITMPEYVFPETVGLAELEELSYRLFVSWDMVHIDGGEVYWDYGILDKENSTWKKAVERYSWEMEKVLGYPEEIIWENTDEDYWGRLRRENMERITDISPDGQSYLTYRNGIGRGSLGEFTVTGDKREMKIYHQNQCFREVESDLFSQYGGGVRVQSAPFGILLDVRDIYYLLEGTMEHYNLSDWEFINCLNQDATLMASEDAGTIRLYDVQSRQCLYCFEQLYSPEETFYLDVHQLAGDKDSGFILFEDQTGVYNLHYPSGEVELVGHYMINPSLSPDGKYLFYTGKDAEFGYNFHEGLPYQEEYSKIPWGGMYIKELQTGRTAYIAMGEKPRCETVAVRWLEVSDT